MYDTLVRRILELARTIPDKKAVVFRKECLTYKMLAEAIAQVGTRLKMQHIGAGDRVLVTAVSKPETFVLFLGVQYVGGTAVFIDKNATQANALAIYDEVEASVFYTDIRMKEEVPEQYRIESQKAFYKEVLQGEALPAAEYELPDPEGIAEILFTSGTTGRPKGVMLAYRSVYHILTNTKNGIGITPDDVTLMPLPLHHSLALRECRAVLWQGGTVVLQNGFTFATEIESNLDQHGCTGFVAVPVSMELLRGQMQDHFYEVMGRFRYMEIGAGALTVEQRKRLSAHLPNTIIHNTWGSSETGGAVFTLVHEAVKSERTVATIGKAIDTVEIKVLDAEGNAIVSDAEHPGRLALRGGMVMAGYWKREELTRDALRDGWLVTNDLVYLDEEGWIYMLGRTDDMINIGGEKLSPLEVENVACEYPYMKECACIGVADTKGALGQVPVLYIAVNDGYTEADLRKYLASRMERFKIPHAFVEVDALPRNAMQKIDRKAIRRLWSEGQK